MQTYHHLEFVLYLCIPTEVRRAIIYLGVSLSDAPELELWGSMENFTTYLRLLGNAVHPDLLQLKLQLSWLTLGHLALCHYSPGAQIRPNKF